jgi:ribose-phosphate pyrophosphokinase
VTIHTFSDSENLGRRLATINRTSLAPIALHTFPDRETLVRVRRPAGRQAVVLRSLDDPNRKLLEVLLAADALRRAGASTVTLVCPYLSYMRQDRVFHPGEPISQRVVAGLLSGSFDRVVTLQAHLHRIATLAAVFQCPAQSLSAAPAIAAWVTRQARDGYLVIGPDRESGRLVKEVAGLTGLRAMVGVKQRLRDRSVKVAFARLPKATGAIIVDDIASSGATIAAVIQALRPMGIGNVDVVVVHALFERGAITRIRGAGARRIVSCDTIVHPTNAIEIAPLLAETLRSAT